jgi:hypothetical protein
MPNPPHEPTTAQRQLVQLHAAIGTPQVEIAREIGIDKKTLAKHYRDELDTGMTKANARIGKALFDKAVNGDTTALIWWTKTRMGWKETTRHEGAGENGEHVHLYRFE